MENRDDFKTHFVAKLDIFERDEKDKQKDWRRSSSYVEDLFVKSDEVVAKNMELQQKGVLKSSRESVLTISDISHTFVDNNKRLETLKNVSFDVQAGEFLSIVGPSGGGKSTLLRIIAGLIKPTHGSLQLSTGKLAMVFQNFAIFPWLTVYENIEFGLKMAGMPKNKRASIISEKIKEVGLSGFDKKRPKELSGGMCQRVGLARALAMNPELLIMDEPFSSLDTFTAKKLRLDLLEIWYKYKMTVVMVTHLIEEALELSDRIIVITKRPAEVKQIVEVNLNRPRDTRSQHFFSLLDKITTQIEL